MSGSSKSSFFYVWSMGSLQSELGQGGVISFILIIAGAPKKHGAIFSSLFFFFTLMC